jgi:hypothetical protein
MNERVDEVIETAKDTFEKKTVCCPFLSKTF